MDECIGCGWCCRKSPCSFYQLEAKEAWHGCPHLDWKDDRWVCGKYIEEQDPRWKAYMAHTLAFGEGCCCNLNTYRRTCHVPTPEELKDEKALLDRLHHPKG
jgi:hypothetical protein